MSTDAVTAVRSLRIVILEKGDDGAPHPGARRPIGED